MGEFMQGVKTAFSGWVIFFYLIFYTLVGGGYFYILSSDAVVSLIIGATSSFVFFFSFNIIQSRITKKAREMSALNDYVTTLVFYMKTGKNVLESLEETRKVADEIIHEDIDIVIRGIEEDAELNVEQFKKHKFTGLDIFHNNLEIKFKQGGDAHDIFQNTTKGINFEISKRDELMRNKEYVVRQEYATVGLILAIPGIIALATGNVYQQFLSTGFIAIIPLAIFYYTIVGTVYFLRKKQQDIEVSL